ncbi:MAG: right-handed parallel beta-helix repeat-containing protein [Clostridia bacterium]|nr:right-handed parallel beta-helix repeat-containing protein [Clostridia bacterium]
MKLFRKGIVCILILSLTLTSFGVRAALAETSDGSPEGEDPGPEQTVGMPSPLKEAASVDELNAAVGCCLFRLDPELYPVTDEVFTLIDGEKQIADYSFSWDGMPATLRAAVSQEDISGIYMDDGKMPFEHLEEGSPYAILDTGYGLWTRWFLGGMQYSLCVKNAGTDAEDAVILIRDLESLTYPWYTEMFEELTVEPDPEQHGSSEIAYYYRNEIGEWNAGSDTPFGTGTEKPFNTVAILAEGDEYLHAPEDTRPVVTVSDVNELIAALAPDTIIRLEPGVYNLSDAEGYGAASGEHYRWIETYLGYELYVENADNLMLVGSVSETEGTVSLDSEICTDPRYANVLNFRNSDGVTVVGLKIGHTETGECIGGVVNFVNCDGVKLSGCELYGCGTVGIIARNCDGLRAVDLLVHSCSMGMVEMTACDSVSFEKISFLNVSGYSGITLDCCGDVAFSGCDFAFNQVTALFYLQDSKDIRVNDCLIAYNSADMLLYTGTDGAADGSIVFEGGAITGYSMPYGCYETVTAG